jgi:glycosyltransferase involved in cell wall biosynthesis
MRIVIDAHQLAANPTGTDRLARSALRELALLDPDSDYRILVNAHADLPPELARAPNFHPVPLDIRRRAAWLVQGLPRLLSRVGADVFFSFHNLSAPGIRRCRTVVTVLDLVPFVHQRAYYPGWRSYWLRRPLVLGTMRRAVRVADHFLAISQFTKSSLVERFGVAADRVAVAHLQVDPAFREPRSPAALEEIRRRHGLPPRFVFTLGGSEPRKNVATLIQAHRQLPEELRRTSPLLIGGSAWPGTSLPRRGDGEVRWMGFIPEADLPGVYQAATVFAFPSLYEGFGLPVLEAMASGTPVLAAAATSLPEVAGDAALLVDPLDPAAMAKGLAGLLGDPQRREALVQAGQARLGAFSWRRFAETVHRLLTGA